MRLKLDEERVFVAHFSFHPESSTTVCILHPAPCVYSLKEDGSKSKICTSHRTHGHVGVGRRKHQDSFTYLIGRKQALQSALRTVTNRALRKDIWRAYWDACCPHTPKCKCAIERFDETCKRVFSHAA